LADKKNPIGREEYQAALEHIRSKKEEYLDIMKRLVAQPSISARGEGVEECAHLLVEIMEDLGISARTLPTRGFPVVYGEVGSGDFTLLFYGHYDVQPPEPLEEWISPPFEPTERDGRLYGRGTGDNKGQLLCHLLAVHSYLQVRGDLPLKIKFILEGEEESGSPHLAEFASENQELLAADLVYTSDGPLHESGAPAIYYGVRGMLALEMSLQTAAGDNHSGNKGGVIPNAAWELVKILSSMRDEQDRVRVKGFNDQVRPPTAKDQELIRNMDFEPEQIARNFGVEKIDLDQEDFYWRLTLQPTMSINGLSSGYQGQGTKTIIPARASAKMDCRLVADQDPPEIFELLKQHIQGMHPGVQVTRQGYMYPSRTDPGLEVCERVLQAVQEATGEKPVALPATGGSLPDYVWTRILKQPSIIVPYANADEDNHAPNENLDLDCFYQGLEITARVIYELSR